MDEGVITSSICNLQSAILFTHPLAPSLLEGMGNTLLSPPYYISLAEILYTEDDTIC